MSHKPGRFNVLRYCCVVAVLAVFGAVSAQTPTPSSGEARASRALEVAKKQGAPELYAFLKEFPKGGDLHMHLSGAIYAETFLAEAAKQNLCVDPTAKKFVQPAAKAPLCPAPLVTASDAVKNQDLYDQLIDAFSMRSFVPSNGWSGHDQFFSTFAKFGGLKNVQGEWLDEVATRAAAQNEQYLEIMQTPTFGHAAGLGYKFGWPAGAEKEVTAAQLAQLRNQLLAAGLRDEVALDIKEFADAQASQQSIEHCPGPGFVDLAEHSGCNIRIHWLYQILRGFPPQQVFAQTLLGFEVASADPDVVGLNFVMPEDGRISMQDYHLQMQMLDYLHGVYPGVHISLHAGELAPGLVTPDGLTFHIWEAIELGHAERIGHGVDVLYESDSTAMSLLKMMADSHIDVEINLTSNEGILGIKGSDHPLHAYMAAHVPFSLSTDDEGVSRIDLTHEYVKAVVDQNLTYADLKTSARNSLEFSFLHGLSLYAHPGDFTHRIAACAATITATPATACAAFLGANEKAAQQYELERRFAAFEARIR